MRIARRDRVGEFRRIEAKAFHGFLAALQSGQIGANKSVAQNVADRGQNVRGSRSGKIAAKRNERAKLVAWLVFEKAGRRPHDSLPQEVENVGLFKVFRKAKHL